MEFANADGSSMNSELEAERAHQPKEDPEDALQRRIKEQFNDSKASIRESLAHKLKFQQKFLESVGPEKNTFLFVNDPKHARHKKKKNKGKHDDVGPPPDMRVSLKQIYNDGLDKKPRFINENQQASLNNDYDYSITQMFRIFLKQDDVYTQQPRQKEG